MAPIFLFISSQLSFLYNPTIKIIPVISISLLTTKKKHQRYQVKRIFHFHFLKLHREHKCIKKIKKNEHELKLKAFQPERAKTMNGNKTKTRKIFLMWKAQRIEKSNRKRKPCHCHHNFRTRLYRCYAIDCFSLNHFLKTMTFFKPLIAHRKCVEHIVAQIAVFQALSLLFHSSLKSLASVN